MIIYLNIKNLLLGLVMNTSALAAVCVDDIYIRVNNRFCYLFISLSTAILELPIPLDISKNGAYL